MVGCHDLKFIQTQVQWKGGSQSDCEKNAQYTVWECSTRQEVHNYSANYVQTIEDGRVPVIVRLANLKLQVLNKRFGTVCILGVLCR